MTYDLLKKNPKNHYLEVTVHENKGHSQTISHLMETSFIKKEREKANKMGIMDKIQKKIQKTKESVRKMLHKPTKTPPTAPKKPVSGIIFNFPSMQEEVKENDEKSIDNSMVSNKDNESEELAFSRKKVSVYLDNVKIDCDESLILNKPESEEHLNEFNGDEDINEEGLGEEKKNILTKNFINKNQFKLKFANIEDVNFPSNSNEKINDVMETVQKPIPIKDAKKNLNSEDKKNESKTIVMNSPNSPGKDSNKFKRRGNLKKSLSINPIPVSNIPRIFVYEAPGRFSLGVIYIQIEFLLYLL